MRHTEASLSPGNSDRHDSVPRHCRSPRHHGEAAHAGDRLARGKSNLYFSTHAPKEKAARRRLSSGRSISQLALLWQNLFAPVFFNDLFSAVWTPLRGRPKDEIDDGVTNGGHGWLRRRSVDSFFSASRVRGDDAAGRRRQSLSSARGDEDPAMIAPRSDQVRAPPSTADGPVHKSILP